MTEKIISTLAFETVKHVFSGLVGREASHDVHPAVRLKNLLPDEIKSFLSLWEIRAEGSGIGGVTVLGMRCWGILAAAVTLSK